MIVPATRWHAFSNRAGEYGVTPTMALATCFSAVLARWGGLTRLLLNITLFDRQPLHSGGWRDACRLHQYSSAGYRLRWRYRQQLARKNQLTFTEDWEHRHWSGVELPVNSNASSATPTAPRWYLPAIWGVPLQQPRRIAVGRAGMGHLANAAGLDRSSGVRASRRGLATMGQQRRAVPSGVSRNIVRYLLPVD